MAGFKLFPGRIAQLTSESGIVGRFVGHFVQDVVVRAALNAPVETGRLSRSIGVLKAEYGPTGIIVKVGSLATNPRNDFMYARAQHTGARARRAKDPSVPMKFKPRRSSKYITKLRVGPIHANPYLTDAMREANITLPSGQKFRLVVKNDRWG